MVENGIHKSLLGTSLFHRLVCPGTRELRIANISKFTQKLSTKFSRAWTGRAKIIGVNIKTETVQKHLDIFCAEPSLLGKRPSIWWSCFVQDYSDEKKKGLFWTTKTFAFCVHIRLSACKTVQANSPGENILFFSCKLKIEKWFQGVCSTKGLVFPISAQQNGKLMLAGLIRDKYRYLACIALISSGKTLFTHVLCGTWLLNPVCNQIGQRFCCSAFYLIWCLKDTPGPCRFMIYSKDSGVNALMAFCRDFEVLFKVSQKSFVSRNFRFWSLNQSQTFFQELRSVSDLSWLCTAQPWLAVLFMAGSKLSHHSIFSVIYDCGSYVSFILKGFRTAGLTLWVLFV